MAKRIKEVTVPANQQAALSHLGNQLLLTYALRNADCHTKNIALLYQNRSDVRLAPVYDMLTTTVYDEYCKNPPGMSVNGRSTWSPGKSLMLFLQTFCGIGAQEIHARVERICEAIVDISPQVVRAARSYASFQLIGPRMLHMWNEGMNSLRLQKSWSLPTLTGEIERAGWTNIAMPKSPAPSKIGRSPLSPM